MERSEILEAMGGLKLFGMKAASAVKRQHEPQRIVGDLLSAELSEKQARSIRYQIAVAKLPIAKEIEEFVFDETPINETLVRDAEWVVVLSLFAGGVVCLCGVTRGRSMPGFVLSGLAWPLSALPCWPGSTPCRQR